MKDAITVLGCDLREFHERLLHGKREHEEYKRALTIAALLFFVAGLAALHFDLVIGAVVLIAISAVFYQGAAHHDLLADMKDSQWLLALLINGREKDRAPLD